MKENRNSKYVNFKYAKGKTDIYGKTFHGYYEIYLFLNGNVEFINNHTRHILMPFQLVIIPPGEYHQFAVKDDIDSYERCVIDVYPELLESAILKKALSGKELISLNKTDRLTNHFFYLIECLSSVDNSDFSHVLTAVATDIIFLIKNSVETQQLFHGNLSPLSLKLMDYINEHYTEHLNLNMLSDVFYCSVSSICHSFEKDFGISIKKYIMQKRINAANMAIQRGEAPEAVSAEYGFSDYTTFFRNYKKHYGISPSKSKTIK